MSTEDFEARMKAREYFHSLRLVPGTWTILRVDGRGFSRFTETHFEKPFDSKFHAWMVESTRLLMENLGGSYAYTESDEASILFRPEWGLFDREVEKIVSVSAGLMSAAFTKASGLLAHFDSRIWVGSSVGDVIDYFRWRQSDAARCALNGWCYWTLRKSGLSENEATRQLERTTPGDKNELLFRHGINFNEVPLWQRRGVGLTWETYDKDGVNPKSGDATVAKRRRIALVDELPMKDEYSTYLQAMIERSIPA